MTTITEIGEFFYKLLNVNELTSLLEGGKIYRNQREKNSTANDIIIRALSVEDDYRDGVHNGQVQIVLIINKIGDLPDLKKQYEVEKKNYRAIEKQHENANSQVVIF